jgi:pyridoxine 5-phosphate synthase
MIKTRLNLEMSIAAEIVEFACRIKPDQATLVPERRQEVTTEGGLDILAHRAATTEAVRRLIDAGIAVSMFIDPCARQIDASVDLGAAAVELHTGCYANAESAATRHDELVKLARAGVMVRQAGLELNAGHGLTYRNVVPVARIEGMGELNIGHSIVARAIFVGLTQAVREMRQLIA